MGQLQNILLSVGALALLVPSLAWAQADHVIKLRWTADQATDNGTNIPVGSSCILINSVIDTSDKVEGSGSMKTTHTNQGTRGCDFQQQVVISNNWYDGQWVCDHWAMKFDAALNWNLNQHKFKSSRWLSGSGSVFGTTVYMNEGNIHWDDGDCPGGCGPCSGGCATVEYPFEGLTGWHRYTYGQKKQSASGVNDGVVVLWVDGVEVDRVTGVNWPPDGGGDLRRAGSLAAMMMGQQNQDPAGIVWADDFLVTTGPSECLSEPVGDLAVSITSSDTDGIISAGTAGVTFTSTVTAVGTGPDYQILTDCNGDGTAEDTVSINDDATPGPSASDVGDCDAIFSVANGNPGYTVVSTVKDFANQGAGVGTPVDTASASMQMIVNGSPSQCPADPTTASAALTKFRLINTDTNDVAIEDFVNGSTVPFADRFAVTIQAVGNTYLNGGVGTAGSVDFILDGVHFCDPDSLYFGQGGSTLGNAPGYAGVQPTGAHVLYAVPYDENGCTGAAGTTISVNFTTASS